MDINDILKNKWEIGKTKDGIEVSWFPLCTVSFNDEYKRFIGLSQEGIWMSRTYIGGYCDLFEIKNRNDCYWILAIIDKERDEIERLLKSGIKENHLPLELFDSFPIKEILKFTLIEGSDHWKSRATEWLREDEIDDELCSIIDKVIKEKVLDQKNRHRLFKLMKRYENKYR